MTEKFHIGVGSNPNTVRAACGWGLLGFPHWKGSEKAQPNWVWLDEWADSLEYSAKLEYCEKCVERAPLYQLADIDLEGTQDPRDDHGPSASASQAFSVAEDVPGSGQTWDPRIPTILQDE